MLLEFFGPCFLIPNNKDTAFIKQVVDEHNKYRSTTTPTAADMIYMTWDHELSVIAQGYADQCIYDHNPKIKQDGATHSKFPRLGENIWLASKSVPIFPTKSWVELEVAGYNYETRKCTDVCGHYTQVVWATSYKVGCGVAFCATLKESASTNMHLVVCDYAPPGNYPWHPYQKGSPCSKCPKEFPYCKNRLCSETAGDSNGNSAEESSNVVPTPFVQMCSLTFFFIHLLF